MYINEFACSLFYFWRMYAISEVLFRHYLSFSKACANCRTFRSSNRFPTICRPIGSPSDMPAFTVMAGWPVMSNGAVFFTMSREFLKRSVNTDICLEMEHSLFYCATLKFN